MGLVNCIPALVTPFSGKKIDYEKFESLVGFQKSQGVLQVLANGTTGESPTTSSQEQDKMISIASASILTIAGAGSNCTDKTLRRSAEAIAAGATSLLLVDPYYNGPSSMEIRKEYYEPVAENFPCPIIPYVIPGRCGCEPSAYDLAQLAKDHENIVAVKQATGNLDRMRLDRSLSPNLGIYSGDDDLTLKMIADPQIKACGVISVACNVVPASIKKLCDLALAGKTEEAAQLNTALLPLFSVLTVKSTVKNPYGYPGEVVQKFRNPLPYKTLMAGLGMMAFGCRQPLGRMNKEGVEAVRAAVRKVWQANPEILAPIEGAFDVDLSARIEADANWGMYYD